MPCRVKICGITNLEDALAACHDGADALGFVFYEKSPRYIDPVKANAIVSQLPPFVVPVALFVDASAEDIEAVVADNARWLIQFHGNESEQECLSYNRSYIKALRVKEGDDLQEAAQAYQSASAILLDAYKAGVPGGTGEVFNWSLIPEEMPLPVILAGGLTPDNVARAVEQVAPYAVDVSGGVEASKGIKNKLKVKQFISGAKREQ
ncbi:phosphoribosylanthranilate isomerase [Marinomonas pollencensis]|uniref:N-(5'-phosphoribosyl)anthranilate isomerase n=1 Tax=Marinomonas pollencensis TaxID=491954 RepID=A0A3E0DKJ7_9GAMM|nr:phosphoribosylanthranilate isomerase [Marinomonas pollencensis]REG83296.1 phosphoribosylanthranilate isomerase [Marinomonas pollencensis]